MRGTMSAAQTAAQTVRKYTKRFLGLGWARVFLILGVVFTLIAIANPLWSSTFDRGGGNYTTSAYGWSTVTRTSYEGGVWSQTLIQSYSASGFTSNTIANAMGGSYLAAVAFLIVLFVAVALFSLEWVQRLPSLGLLIIGLVVVVFALVALLYPLLTVPTAAASSPGLASVTGYWGSIAAAGGTLSWGAAAGWWALLIGVILAVLGGIWPFLQALRTPMARRLPPPPPREWQVER